MNKLRRRSRAKLTLIKLAKFLDGGGVSLIYFQYFLDMSQNCWVFIEAIHLYCLVSIPYNMDWSEFAVSKYWYWANGFPFLCTLFWALAHKTFNEYKPTDDSIEDQLLMIKHDPNYDDNGTNAAHLNDNQLNDLCLQANFTDVFISNSTPGLEALNMSHYDAGSSIFFFPGNFSS